MADTFYFSLPSIKVFADGEQQARERAARYFESLYDCKIDPEIFDLRIAHTGEAP